MTNRPDRKERKRRIKEQNEKASEQKREPMNPEDLDRVVDGFMMIVFGILKVANINPMTGLKEAEGFPSELPEEFPSEIRAEEVKGD